MKEKVLFELRVVNRLIEKTEADLIKEKEVISVSLNKAYLRGYKYTKDVLENILKEGE